MQCTQSTTSNMYRKEKFLGFIADSLKYGWIMFDVYNQYLQAVRMGMRGKLLLKSYKNRTV